MHDFVAANTLGLVPGKFAIIGNAVVDVVRGVDTLPPLNEHTDNTRVRVLECCDEPGGNAINTAIVLAKISDASIAVFSAIGGDHFGETIKSSCDLGRPFAKANLLTGKIDLINANSESREPTGTAIVLLERSSNRTMFLYHAGCNARVDAAFLRKHLNRFEGAQFLHISGFGGLPGIDRGQNLAEFVEVLRDVRRINERIEIVFDVMFLDEQAMRESNLRNAISPLLEQVDYFVPNELEAAQWSSSGAKELEDLAREYNRRVRAATIIKRGPRGVTIFPRDGDATNIEPTTIVPKIEIVDTIGAGDAWCAGFLSALATIDQDDPMRLQVAAARGNEVARESLFARGGNAAFFLTAAH